MTCKGILARGWFVGDDGADTNWRLIVYRTDGKYIKNRCAPPATCYAAAVSTKTTLGCAG